jgi:hypothetical protein
MLRGAVTLASFVNCCKKEEKVLWDKRNLFQEKKSSGLREWPQN